MTLGGLLKHLAWVEDFWFAHTAGHAPMPDPWADVDRDVDHDWEWTSALEDDAATLREAWQRSVERSRRLVTELLTGSAAGLDGSAVGLDTTHPAWGGRADVSLRWILLHMVEEYARHNGHADLLREAVDGEIGE